MRNNVPRITYDSILYYEVIFKRSVDTEIFLASDMGLSGGFRPVLRFPPLPSTG